jgi:DNA-binding transcriptional regulator YhcF (GntR family)
MKKHILVPPQEIPQESVDMYSLCMRHFSIVINDYLLKYLNSLYAEFHGDLVKAIVLGELAHHNISGLLRDQVFLKEFVAKQVNLDAIHHDLRPGNPFSISEATGIPRETVRRKFTELVKEGLVEKVKPKSYVITARVSERFIHSFNLQLFEETHRLCSKINAIITQTKPDYPTMIKP